MARKPRQYGDTGIYHIIIRGNNQENLFYDNEDRIFMLQRLRKYVKQLEIDLYAYCLMGNHVHLLIGKGNYSMPLFVKKLTCSYVYYFNHKYERTGHLFQGRYKSEPVENIEYFKTVYRYIIQNPEKAGICYYSKYDWSSYHLISEEKSFISNTFTIQLFENRTNLYKFLDSFESCNCMEDIYQPPPNDEALMIEFIKILFEIKSPLDIAQFDLHLMKKYLFTLKKVGLSVSQISRLTSISRKIIREA